MALKKPLLVLKKKREMDDDGENSSKSHCTELEVVGIIRHRILFKTRPKALISSTSFFFFHVAPAICLFSHLSVPSLLSILFPQ